MRNDRAGALSGTKIISLNRLKSKIRRLKQNGWRIVFTNGCFDILHYGHVKYLQDARRKGDCLVVAVNSDSSVKKIKARNRPVIPQSDRLKTVAALSGVDFVVLFNEDNPLRLIKALKPDVLIKGADWDKKKIIGAEFVTGYGGKVLTVNLVKGR
ncbi:MAG: D-glycero-beta-D-manno-heptose 1-phosphate adenylyltransferase, partial [Candidatus Omnitrophica bacterium CG11_big_fil_rev_8_21_14_0_20_43_6]